jgi:type VI secretion system protein ImpM
MGVGVFGKLPARRDYVQHGVDPRLMELLDPWLQRCVADSRRALGETWLDAWLEAPIWRFWLGSRVCGMAAIASMMPSVDGVGRYFPLCVLGAFDGVPPPSEDEHSDWFAAVEGLMLGALAEGAAYEDLLAGLGALTPPAPVRPRACGADSASEVPDAFAALVAGMAGEPLDRCSCWWLSSWNREGAPRALIRRGLPSPEEYAALIAPGPQPVLTPANGGA